MTTNSARPMKADYSMNCWTTKADCPTRMLEDCLKKKAARRPTTIHPAEAVVTRRNLPAETHRWTNPTRKDIQRNCRGKPRCRWMNWTSIYSVRV